MNTKLTLILTVVLVTFLTGCSSVHVSPEAKKIVKNSARYYQSLNSFEGTNIITDEGSFIRSGNKLTQEKQFAFLRPDKFLICSGSTNDNQLICDGRNVSLYKPYYWNSYTKTPAPKRFENAVTNWIGGELVRLMASPHLYAQFKSGFGNGLKSLNYAGEDNIEGISCHHLVMELKGEKTADVWIVNDDSSAILKYSLKFPTQKPKGGIGIHTETITGWVANQPIPESRFMFTPLEGAIEQPAGADEVKLSYDSKTGKTKVIFYSSPTR